MKKFLVSGIAVLTAISTTNTWASGYLCNNITYQKCQEGRYLDASGNCETCPSLETIWTNFKTDVAVVGDYALSDFYEIGWNGGNALTDIEYILTTEQWDGFTCKLTITGGWNIAEGKIISNAGRDASLFCGVVNNQAAADWTGVEIGKYACIASNTGGENIINCNGGYELQKLCLDGDSESCNVHNDGTGDLLVVKTLTDLACTQVPAGRYSPDDSIYSTNCPMDDEEKGYYCPAGSAAPQGCPEATNAYAPNNLEQKISVYGKTGMNGATSITACHLPAGDDIWYANDEGWYTLDSNCEYFQTHGNGTAGDANEPL